PARIATSTAMKFVFDLSLVSAMIVPSSRVPLDSAARARSRNSCAGAPGHAGRRTGLLRAAGRLAARARAVPRRGPAPLEGQLGDAVDERRVVQAGRLGAGGELAGLFEIAVGVDLDHVDLPRVGQAEVDAGVVADEQGAAGVERGLLQAGLEVL